jgi:tetratricopeptide (TPR) repeat protein
MLLHLRHETLATRPILFYNRGIQKARGSMSKRRGKRRSGKGSTQGAAALARNGLRAFQGRDYDRAIDAWERARQQAPDRASDAALAEAYFRRGLDHVRTSELEAGLADLQHAAELQPDDPCYAHHLGLAAYRSGDLGRAIRAFAVARRGDTEFAARAAYPMALALLQRGDDPSTHTVWSALSDEERAMLRQASVFRRRPYSLPPEAPVLWRGLSMLDQGDTAGAREALQQVLAQGSSGLEKGVAHYYLGVMAAADERWEDAARAWNAARGEGYDSSWLEQNSGELYHRLAEERLEEGDIEGALAAAEEAHRHKPGDNRLEELISQVYQQRGYRAVSAGEWEEALKLWHVAYAAGGGSFRLAYNLALGYEHAEEWIRAGATWREALRHRPRKADHPDAISDEEVARLWRRSAEAYDHAGEYEEAANVYRQALKWNPDDLETRMALAEGLMNDGRLVAAQNELDRILERDPDHIPALLRMGEAIAQEEIWWHQSSAPWYWQRVLELDPDNASARQSLVEFALERGENLAYWGSYGLAIDTLQEVRELQPDDGRILAALGTCYVRMGDEETGLSYIELAQTKDPQNPGVYRILLDAWIEEGDVERAREVMAQAEAAIDDLPFAFYMSQAALCLESEYDEELAPPWLERAVEKAPPGEPILEVIGEMAMMAQAPSIAREYLERAIAAGQATGQAYLILGMVAALADDDLTTAKKHWRRAERIARKEGDEELAERIEVARSLFSTTPNLWNLLGDPLFFDDFDPADSFPEEGEDMEDEDDDDLFFF